MVSTKFKIPPVFSLSHVKGHEPFNIFTTNKKFVFTIYLQKIMPTDSYVYWWITDYFQEVILNGIAVVSGGQKNVTVTVEPLEAGHYVVDAFAGNEIVSDNFAVVVPYENRPQHLNSNFDSPFAIETSIGITGAWCRGDHYKSLINDFAWAVKYSGVTWVHQRMIWTDAGSLGWSNEPLVAFKKHNLKVLQCFQFVKDAIDINIAAPGDNLPNDLRIAYNMAKKNGGFYSADKDQVHMWEPWNEPEASGFLFTGPGEGADRYAAVLKAMSIGFRDCGMQNPLITNGGFLSRDPTSNSWIKQYQDNLFENEILHYIDVYSFHNHLANVYQKAETDYTKAHYKYYNSDYMFVLRKNTWHIDKHKEMESLTGILMPIWITEAGGGIANSPNGLDLYDKQVAQARYLVTSTVMSLSTGVDKHFWFGGQPGWAENNRPYGNLYWSCFSQNDPRTNHITPYAAYAALAALTEVMGEAIYLGKMLKLPIGTMGYVFKNESDTVLVLWAKENTNVFLDLQKIKGIQTDIMGRKRVASSVSGVFKLHLSADPIYLKIEGTIPVQVYTASNYMRKSPVVKTLTAAQRIVLDQMFPIASRSHDVKLANGYIIQRNEPTQVKVMVYNFNKNISVFGTVIGSVNTSIYSVSMPQTVLIAANSQKTLTFTVMLVGTPAGNSAKLSFTGFFDVGQTTPTVAFFKAN
jgi:hypothetical protein